MRSETLTSKDRSYFLRVINKKSFKYKLTSLFYENKRRSFHRHTHEAQKTAKKIFEI